MDLITFRALIYSCNRLFQHARLTVLTYGVPCDFTIERKDELTALNTSLAIRSPTMHRLHVHSPVPSYLLCEMAVGVQQLRKVFLSPHAIFYARAR